MATIRDALFIAALAGAVLATESDVSNAKADNSETCARNLDFIFPLFLAN